jgi:hypothetical protein
VAVAVVVAVDLLPEKSQPREEVIPVKVKTNIKAGPDNGTTGG